MIFDGHGDILTDVTIEARKGIDIWKTYHKSRYEQAGVNSGIFVNFTNPNVETQKEDFKEITKVALPYFKNNPDFNIIYNKEDFIDGKFNLILGIEGMAAVDSSDELEALFEAGYRHIGITWNEKNNFASGAQNEGGLTEEGAKLIEKCNQLGMIVDFAHLNDDSFIDAAKVTSKPILFSHGNIRALCEHPRNLNEQELELLVESNGVIGLAAMNFFINEDKENATIDDLVAQVVYMKENYGIDYVGFGFDFCYYLGSHQGQNDVKGLEHIDDVPTLITKLEDAGLTSNEIEKVAYKNMLRLVKEHLK